MRRTSKRCVRWGARGRVARPLALVLACCLLPAAAARAEVEGVTIELVNEAAQTPLHGDLERLSARFPNPLRIRSGVVGEVSREGPSITVDGLEYRFTPDADVRLRGGFGAPTMLDPGMAIEFIHEIDAAANSAGSIRVLREVELSGDMLH